MIRIRNEFRGIKIGSRIGRLVVIGQQFRLTIISRNKKSYGVWCVVVKCDCGTISTKTFNVLLRTGENRVVACGCVLRQQSRDRHLTHGKTRTKLHHIWIVMRERCRNSMCKSFPRYGGRGIRVCDEWDREFMAFDSWALANGYREGLTVDRINNDGNYEPANCQLLTRAEHARKTHRDRKRYHHLTKD